MQDHCQIRIDINLRKHCEMYFCKLTKLFANKTIDVSWVGFFETEHAHNHM